MNEKVINPNGRDEWWFDWRGYVIPIAGRRLPEAHQQTCATCRFNYDGRCGHLRILLYKQRNMSALNAPPPQRTCANWELKVLPVDEKK